jgi:predicted lipid-binding transport protein (Tim44 family)
MAFSKGDRATLRQLLADEVFDTFDGAIDARERRNETKETIIVALEAKSIDSANVLNNVAHITVRFSAKLIAFTKDQAGAVVEGNVEKVVDHVDLWTFARLVTSPDPNWKLEATEPVG